MMMTAGSCGGSQAKTLRMTITCRKNSGVQNAVGHLMGNSACTVVKFGRVLQSNSAWGSKIVGYQCNLAHDPAGRCGSYRQPHATIAGPQGPPPPAYSPRGCVTRIAHPKLKVSDG